LRIAKLERMASLLLDVRKRAFLTYQRDNWRGQLFNTQNSRIQTFNESTLHGGVAELDTIMFRERRPETEMGPILSLYGIGSNAIIQIGEFS